MPYALKRVCAPTSEPVSLTQIKNQLNVDDDSDDDLLSAFISAAREHAERYTGRSFMPQQWLHCRDYFPAFRIGDGAPSRSDFDAIGNYNFNAWRNNGSQTIVLARPPLISVDSVQYLDLASGSLLTLDPSQYQVDLVSEPGRILPSTGGYWPETVPALNSVQILFTTGYVLPVPSEPLSVPAAPGPFAVTLQQAANFWKLTSVTDASGNPIASSEYSASPSGVVTFLADQAGKNLLANYQVTAVPKSIQQAIRLAVGAWYVNREDYLLGISGATELPLGSRALLDLEITQPFGA
jgi:hypothetical protein